MKLSTTAAVVTGGASGLGEATARHFAAQGAQVTILDRDAERGVAVAAEIGGYFAETDVTDEDLSRRRRLHRPTDRMGRISRPPLTAPALPMASRRLVRTALIRFGRVPTHHRYQSGRDLQRLAPGSGRDRPRTTPNRDGARGVIINTASIAAFDGQKGQSAYAASKGRRGGNDPANGARSGRRPEFG